MLTDFRCDCPITSALDVLGDKWMLVLVKLMLLEGKQTFKQFLESDEGVATNILATKLKLLEAAGIVSKTKAPHSKKQNDYILTEKGLSLTPVIIELAAWADQHLRARHPTIINDETTALLRQDKTALAHAVAQQYRAKHGL